MAKQASIPDELRRVVVAAITAVHAAGCPVVSWRPDRQAHLADVCLRRWRSFPRRGVSPNDRAEQVKDLARRLVETSGEDRHLIGPLFVDYRYLAGRVLAAIDQWQSEIGEPEVPAGPPV